MSLTERFVNSRTHVAEPSAASTVADVLKLDFNPVGRFNKDLDSPALPRHRPRAHAVLGEPLADLVRIESLNSESDVRPESRGPASLDQRNELWSAAYAKDESASWFLICLPLQVGQLQIPFERALDIRHHQPDVVECPDGDWRGIAWLASRLSGVVAHITQKSASTAGV